MKIKRIISALLSFFIMTSTLCLPISSLAVEDYSYKIDTALEEKLKNMNDDDVIDVSLWLKDISYDEVYNQTKTALKKDIKKNKASSEVLDLLDTTMCDVSQSAKNSFSNNLNSLAIEQNLQKNRLSISEYTNFLNISSDDAQVLVEEKRKSASDLYKNNNNKIFKRLFSDGLASYKDSPNVLFISSLSPSMDLSLTKKQIFEIIENIDVKNVYLSCFADEEAIFSLNDEEYEEVNTASTTSSNPYTYWQNITGINQLKNDGYTANNIKVGLLETSIPYVENNTGEYGDYYYVFSHMFDQNNPENNRLIYRNTDINLLFNNTNVQDNRGHAIYTASILAGKTNTYEGAAPGIKLYCASTSGENGFKGAVEWLIKQGVSIISESHSYFSNYSGFINYYAPYSIWMDHISYFHNVHFVKSSGNGQKQSDGSYIYENKVTLNSTSYNAIVVGSCNSSSNASNYHSYSTVNSIGIKPDVIAPGISVGTPVNIASGTSCATPIVAAAAAYLCNNNAYCYANPCLVKALLSASAMYLGNKNTPNASDEIGFDRKSGAGIINAYKAYEITTQNSGYPNFQIDYDIGHMYSISALNYSDTFNVDTTDNTIGFSVVWEKMNTLTNENNHDFNNGVEVNGVNVPFPSIKVIITAPNGSQYTSYYANDCKANVVFNPPCTGEYTISYELMSDYSLTTPMRFATAVCKNKGVSS